VDRRIKYGAGEDFFGIVDGGGWVSQLSRVDIKADILDPSSFV
jgi:hypothetical protein